MDGTIIESPAEGAGQLEFTAVPTARPRPSVRDQHRAWVRVERQLFEAYQAAVDTDREPLIERTRREWKQHYAVRPGGPRRRRAR